jgi:hypothetical protein
LAYHHDLTLAVHGVAARVIEGWYRDKGRELGITDPRTGHITAVQRFGSDLALNVHHSGGPRTSDPKGEVATWTGVMGTMASPVQSDRRGEARLVWPRGSAEARRTRTIALTRTTGSSSGSATEARAPRERPDTRRKARAR